MKSFFTFFILCLLHIPLRHASWVEAQKLSNTHVEFRVRVSTGNAPESIIYVTESGISRMDGNNPQLHIEDGDWIDFKIFSNVTFDHRRSCWITSAYPYPLDSTKYMSLALASCTYTDCARGFRTKFMHGEHTKGLNLQEALNGPMIFSVNCQDMTFGNPLGHSYKSFEIFLTRGDKPFSSILTAQKESACTHEYMKPLFFASKFKYKKPDFSAIEVGYSDEYPDDDINTQTTQGVTRFNFLNENKEEDCKSVPATLNIWRYSDRRRFPKIKLPFVHRMYIGPHTVAPTVNDDGNPDNPTYRLDLSVSKIQFHMLTPEEYSTNLFCRVFAETDFESPIKDGESKITWKQQLVLLDCYGLDCTSEKEILFIKEYMEPWKTMQQWEKMHMDLFIYCNQRGNERHFYYVVKLNIRGTSNKDLLSSDELTPYKNYIYSNIMKDSTTVFASPTGVKELSFFGQQKVSGYSSTNQIFYYHRPVYAEPGQFKFNTTSETEGTSIWLNSVTSNNFFLPDLVHLGNYALDKRVVADKKSKNIGNAISKSISQASSASIQSQGQELDINLMNAEIDSEGFPELKVRISTGNAPDSIVYATKSGVMRMDKKDIQLNIDGDWIDFRVFSDDTFEERLSCWITSNYHSSLYGGLLTSYQYLALASCNFSDCARGIRAKFTVGEHTRSLDLQKLLNGRIKFEVHCQDIHKNTLKRNFLREFHISFTRVKKHFEFDTALPVETACTNEYTQPIFLDPYNKIRINVQGYTREIFINQNNEKECKMARVSLGLWKFPALSEIPVSRYPLVSKLHIGPYTIVPSADADAKSVKDIYRLDLSESKTPFLVLTPDKHKKNLHCTVFAETDFETPVPDGETKNEWKESLFLLNCRSLNCTTESELFFTKEYLAPWEKTQQWERMHMDLHIRCNELENGMAFQYVVKLNIRGKVNNELLSIDALKQYETNIYSGISIYSPIVYAPLKTGSEGVLARSFFSQQKVTDDPSTNPIVYYHRPVYAERGQFKRIKTLVAGVTHLEIDLTVPSNISPHSTVDLDEEDEDESSAVDTKRETTRDPVISVDFDVDDEYESEEANNLNENEEKKHVKIDEEEENDQSTTVDDEDNDGVVHKDEDEGRDKVENAYEGQFSFDPSPSIGNKLGEEKKKGYSKEAEDQVADKLEKDKAYQGGGRGEDQRQPIVLIHGQGEQVDKNQFRDQVRGQGQRPNSDQGQLMSPEHSQVVVADENQTRGRAQTQNQHRIFISTEYQENNLRPEQEQDHVPIRPQRQVYIRGLYQIQPQHQLHACSSMACIGKYKLDCQLHTEEDKCKDSRKITTNQQPNRAGVEVTSSKNQESSQSSLIKRLHFDAALKAFIAFLGFLHFL